MKRILVTGFEPFLGQPINPSQRLADALPGCFTDERGFSVHSKILPVTFADGFRALRDAGDFDAYVMFGQAAGRERVSLERVALNWIETRHPDEKGVKPDPKPISISGPAAFVSPLPLDRWCEDLNQNNLKAEVSLSAGGYVCNHLYYSLAEHLLERAPHLFVHVPYLPEQAKNGEPSMEFARMLEAARRIVAWMAAI